MKSLTNTMQVQTVRVSEKGQIAIPSKMRKSLGLRRGSTLLLIEDKGRILVAKAERAAESVADEFADLARHAEKTFKDLWENKADEVWNDL